VDSEWRAGSLKRIGLNRSTMLALWVWNGWQNLRAAHQKSYVSDLRQSGPTGEKCFYTELSLFVEGVKRD
jgi:hypothetical protein